MVRPAAGQFRTNSLSLKFLDASPEPRDKLVKGHSPKNGCQYNRFKLIYN